MCLNLSVKVRKGIIHDEQTLWISGNTEGVRLDNFSDGRAMLLYTEFDLCYLRNSEGVFYFMNVL